MAGSSHLDETAEMEKARDQLQEAFNERGILGIKEYLEGCLQAWKDVPLYIGVTGRSGVGKSSFINAIRSLSATEEGAAKVGVKETTMEAQQYPHPKNEQLVLFDLPGLGTKKFPVDKYFKDQRIGFDKFDFFLILSADRFMADDLRLAEEIKARKKAFFFIRSKIDQDVTNMARARGEGLKPNPNTVKEVISSVRTDCEENLRDFLSEKGGQKVFLIDNLKCTNSNYDFDSLTSQLIGNFPVLKQDAIILSLTTITPGLIENKEKVLCQRIWKHSVLSGIVGTTPIPGISLSLDLGILLKETLFYRSQFGLEPETLKKIAKSMGISFEVFKQSTELGSMNIEYTNAGISQFCKYLVVSKAFKTAAEYALPGLGNVVGASLSFASTHYALGHMLSLMVNDAKKVNEYITKQSV